MKTKIILLALSMMLAASPLFAEMYRYVDEDGQVVYSQFKPHPGVEASTVKAPPPPPSTADQSRQQLIDSLQKREDIKLDKKTAEQEATANPKKKNVKTKTVKLPGKTWKT